MAAEEDGRIEGRSAMNPIFALLEDVEIQPVWLAAGVVLAAGVLVAAVARFSRRRSADARVDLGKPVMEGDLFQHGSRSERRVAPRRGGNPIPILVSDAKAEVEPVRGWVLDRSIGGLGLELEEEGEVDIGTVLSVRPAEGSSVPWIKVEVRTCRKMGSAWRLGCQYLRPPSADILMRFG
jgi:hypothetical protein